MDPEFARDLRERMAASLGSLNRVALELLAERPLILFSHDTSSPDIRRHSECVREPGQAHLDARERRSNKIYHMSRGTFELSRVSVASVAVDEAIVTLGSALAKQWRHQFLLA